MSTRYYQVFRNPETGEITRGSLTSLRTKDGRDVCIVEASSWNEALAKAQEIFRKRKNFSNRIYHARQKLSEIPVDTRQRERTKRSQERATRYRAILREELAKRGFARDHSILSSLPSPVVQEIKEAARAVIQKESPRRKGGGNIRQNLLEGVRAKIATCKTIKEALAFLDREIEIERIGNKAKEAFDKAAKKRAA